MIVTTASGLQQDAQGDGTDGARLRVAVVGAGMMAEAIIRQLIVRDVVAPYDIVVSAPRLERRVYLTETYGLTAVAENAETVRGASVVVLCVKPPIIPKVLLELREALDAHQLIISIAASVSVAALGRLSCHSSIVRSMPNTPARIGEGLTIWVASPTVTTRQIAHTRAIFAAIGNEMEVDDESFLDMAAAISGAGPSYLYLVMEALMEAGVQLGLPRRMSEDMVRQTMLGAARLAQETGQHPAVLKNAVTSPGGITAAALYQLEKGGLRSNLADAVVAAYDQAITLGQNGERRRRRKRAVYLRTS